MGRLWMKRVNSYTGREQAQTHQPAKETTTIWEIRRGHAYALPIETEANEGNQSGNTMQRWPRSSGLDPLDELREAAAQRQLASATPSAEFMDLAPAAG